MAEGRGRLSSLNLVPDHAQDEIVWAVTELNKRSRTQEDIRFELNDRLAVKGVEPISKSAFNRRSLKLAAAARRIDESRHIFAGLGDRFTPEQADETNIVIGEFIKLMLFELAQEDGAARTPKQAMELARGFLATIQALRLSTDHRQKKETEFNARAAKAIDVVATAKGLSAEVKEAFKRELFGVRDG